MKRILKYSADTKPAFLLYPLYSQLEKIHELVLYIETETRLLVYAQRWKFTEYPMKEWM